MHTVTICKRNAEDGRGCVGVSLREGLKMQFVRQTIGGLAGGGATPDVAEASVPVPLTEPELPPAILLVIQADAYDWKAIFAGARLSNGRAINVVQLGWDRLLVTADSPAMSASTPCLVHVRPDPRDGKGGGTIKPDFVLVRNEARGAVYTEDHKNALFGLMFAGLPAVNSLSSIYQVSVASQRQPTNQCSRQP